MEIALYLQYRSLFLFITFLTFMTTKCLARTLLKIDSSIFCLLKYQKAASKLTLNSKKVARLS